MKRSVINFLRKAFPFLTVIFLWRLNIPFWNPGGILVLIPVFYCTFIRPINWFMPFGLLFCFLLDYNLGAICYWTSIYLLCYALNGFQNFIDFTHRDFNSIDVFMLYIAIGLFFFEFAHINWTTFGRMVWTFVWLSTLYTPITQLINRVHNDR
ncbi:MAG: hypothetical protein J5679_03500 [Alphaproteobacteria bacterium]|nr:hypothetical protein [Alphaproteobacteria bacterium]